MESLKVPFNIATDKELTLQILKLNGIPAIEIAEITTSSFPIIGRKFGHHSGRDISIVHTKEQGMEEGYDYFTKLYNFEREYQLEIKGLSVINVQEANVNNAISNDVPIRTEFNGWKWLDIDQSIISEEWFHMVIRAVYVTGITHAFVKIGLLTNGIPLLIDLNPISSDLPDEKTIKNEPFTLGTDVEFMLSCDDELIPASEFFPLEGPIGCDERQIEQDSGEYALAEIRPEQSSSPHELYTNIKKLISEASDKIPYYNIAFRAGSMPFYGYQCGGHLHFGVEPSVSLLRALDFYLAIPLAMIEESSPSRRRRTTKHGGLGRYREKSYGFEYLSLSSWIIEPKITLATLCLAKLIVSHHQELQNPQLYNPIIMRAYYQGNQILLKFLWEDIKKQLINIKGFEVYKSEISVLFDYIERGTCLSGIANIRENWGLSVPDIPYERGRVIYIPRKTRVKYNLIEGQITFVCAGKTMSRAIIRPYPFSFRNSNIIQLSPTLLKELSLPKTWIPKIASVKGAIILGPIMGILADRPFERQATYFQHLSKIAKEKQMFVYVFEPKDILWDKQLIKGTTMDGERLFPFPAVIYDRFFRTSNKQKREMDELRAKLQFIFNIPFINPPSLFDITGDKWKTHQLLNKDHYEYLPETRLLEEPVDIIEMINRHGEIFFKPIGGALSNGIVRAIQRSDGIFWMDSKQRVFQPLNAIDELVSFFFPRKNKDYLVQEAIKRRQLNGNFVELRVYIQKNGQKKWMRTGMVARLTNEGVMSEETEINKRSSHVLNKLFPDQAELRLMRKQISELTNRIAETVEEEVGSFGELAIDLCIDQYNNIKILEINGKPDNLFAQVKAYKLRNIAAHRLLNYATSLAGYEMDN